MLRATCSLASLIHSLLLGTTQVVVVLGLTTTLVSCKDESQPEYWVDKLSEPSWRPRAVKRLEQFFEDAATKANNDLQSQEVKALADKIVDPLTQTYVKAYGEMDTKTRVSLIKLLSSFRDKRTEPALKKAFEEFAKRPKSTKDEQDIKWAAIAVADLKLESAADAMIQTFDKLKASTMLGGIVYRDFNSAMVAMPVQSWSGPLQAKLADEIKPPKSAKDKDLIDPYRDQIFWQTTAAEVLGVLKDASAVPALVKVMLDPAKGDIQATALLALVKIGKPSVDAAVKLLKGQDEALIAFNRRRIKEVSGAAEEPKEGTHVPTAALILGTVGRPEAIDPLVAALKGSSNDADKAVIARELSKIPATPGSIEAFKEAFASISLDTMIPPGMPALPTLAEAAGQFYDPSMLGWLLERAQETAGSGDEKKQLESAITVTVLKLAKPDQLNFAKAAVQKYGTQIEREALENTEALTKACGDRVPCYLAAIEKSENQEEKTQFRGIKAGYMIGILGSEQTRDELIVRLESIDNASVRFVAAQVIDHLSPKGSKDAAAKLLAIIDKNAKSADRDKALGDAPLKQVMYRIETRAE